MECKECIFGDHKTKTCYLEKDCEVMHEWLRKHDEEVRNKAIYDFVEKLTKQFREEQAKGFYSHNSIIGERNVWEKAIEISEQLKDKTKL